MRGTTEVILVVALFPVFGCGRKPADKMVVKVAEKGRASVGGRELSMKELGKLLRERTEASPRDADGLPILTVEISVHPECKYQHVQEVMDACGRPYIWQVRWRMGGKRLHADLPKDSGNYVVHEDAFLTFKHEPIEIVEELFVTESGTGGTSGDEAQAEGAAAAPGARPPSTSPGAATAAAEEAARAAHIARCRARGIHQMRVMICWANEKAEVIYSPAEAFPNDWEGIRWQLSTAGAHLVIKARTIDIDAQSDVSVNTVRVPGLEDLARRLAEFAARDPEAYVVIDARRAVPFRWVLDTLDACKRANVRSVFFEHLRMEGARGDDWFWM